MPSLAALRERYEQEYAEYIKWGIHVMVCQNGNGELTIGDSHEYGLAHTPFNKAFINNMIIDYLATFARFKNNQVAESWIGEYAKMTDGKTEFIHTPQEGVTVVNALSGAGMTLSFGLMERYIDAHH